MIITGLLVAAVITEGVTISQLNTRLVSVEDTASIPGPEGPAGPTGPQGPSGPIGLPGADGLDGSNGQNAATSVTFDNCRFTQRVQVVTDVRRSFFRDPDGNYSYTVEKGYITVCNG